MSLGTYVDELLIKEFYRGQRRLLEDLSNYIEIPEDLYERTLEKIEEQEENEIFNLDK